MNGHWQPDQATWGSYGNAVYHSEGSIYAIKTQLELKLGSSVGDNGRTSSCDQQKDDHR